MVRAAALSLALLAGSADAACRQALILGLDISGSVDSHEYRLQLEGLASALTAPEVMAKALLSPETPVRLAVFEWAGAYRQRLLVDWTDLTTQADMARIAAALRTTRRQDRKGATSIGRAMEFAELQLRAQAECWTHTLDLSGDGKNNDGVPPEVVKDRANFGRITVNGLVIGADVTVGRDERQMALMELSAYYRRRVIRGPGAFIEVALGFEDYQRAMERKLLRELEGLVVGALD